LEKIKKRKKTVFICGMYGKRVNDIVVACKLWEIFFNFHSTFLWALMVLFTGIVVSSIPFLD